MIPTKKSSFHLPQPENSGCGNEGSAQPKTNKYFLKIKYPKKIKIKYQIKYHFKELFESGRERQISYNIAYMWNLEKCYGWTYLQGRNRDTDVEKKKDKTQLLDTKGGKRGEMNWETRIDIYITIDG